MYRKWSTLVLLTLVMPLVAFAQNTGNLTGRVTEAATGDGIPGAIVSVEGTTLGAATDVDGNYTILGVPVGTWNVRAESQEFSPLLVRNVEINSGYTRTLNFALQPIAEGEIVEVIYQRPLIQNDAIGTPRVASSEQIQNLPVRGVASVVATQAGVVSNEGSNTLNIRGGRGEEVVYFVDGVKVIGSNVIPQAAIQEQEMLIGNISARYGDAMSGVINITTKTGSDRFFGSAEAITSTGLDAFGYNLASASLGGPIVGSRVGFFMAGEAQLEDDANPRALGQLVIRDDVRARIAAAPMGFIASTTDGKRVLVPLPASVKEGTTVPLTATNRVVVNNGTITLSDGATVKVGDVLVERLVLRVDRAMEYVHLKARRPSGFEPLEQRSGWKTQDALGYYEAPRDASTDYHMGWLPAGTYVFEMRLRARNAGDFAGAMSQVQSLYAPEFAAHSAGHRVRVAPR